MNLKFKIKFVQEQSKTSNEREESASKKSKASKPILNVLLIGEQPNITLDFVKVFRKFLPFDQAARQRK